MMQPWFRLVAVQENFKKRVQLLLLLFSVVYFFNQKYILSNFSKFSRKVITPYKLANCCANYSTFC